MASKFIKEAVFQNISKRNYAAQAATASSAAQHSYILPPEEPHITTLPSGVVVASVENNAPVSRVAVLFKAGSRYETVANAGVSHMLRLCAGHSTKNMSSFIITRSLQQKGGSLLCETGREHTAYGIDIIRDYLDHGLSIVGEVATSPVFKPWEVESEKGRLLNELAVRDSTALVVDLLHAAAFRTGLGNCLYTPSHRVGKVSSEQLHEFVQGTHTSQRMAVVGLGVDHNALVSYAKSLNIGSGPGTAGVAGKYSGGEIRHENGGPLATVAVSGSGASIGSSDAAALAVAQYILGAGSGVKYGANSSSKLVTKGNGAAMAINVNYSDGGLFGYLVVADAASAGEVVKSVHNSLRSLKITDADVAHGKKMVKVALLMSSESAGESIADMSLQALLTGTYVTPLAASAAIDSVTAATVQAAVSKALGGKLSMVAVGNLTNVPYLDQL